MTADRPLLAYFGHHKCASTWVHNIVNNFCDEAGLRSDYLANEGMFGGDLGGWVREHGTDFLCYANADIEQVRGLPPFRGFHMVRDPRDIMVSAYFSHLHSHKTEAWPALVEHRKRLQSVDKSDGLMLELDFNADVFREMASWDYAQENVLELKMEDLTPDPLNGWMEIFRFLGIVDEEHFGKRRQAGFMMRSAVNVLHRHGRLPLRFPLPALPAERLLGIVHDNRFEAKTGGRKEGQTDVKSHYRKGVAGDWKNHFEPEHVAAFKERQGALLVQLGYEDDLDWTA
ncbi:MAG: sulfotransferase domain-containing protein [Planctomycetes bacterium]|nr:sulfotransferase domain-containing protein [Planctomycetota bacterium]